MTATVTGTQAAEAALDALRHELELLPAEARDEAGRLLAPHLHDLCRLIRDYTPHQRKRS
jgi:hypothetical protein